MNSSTSESLGPIGDLAKQRKDGASSLKDTAYETVKNQIITCQLSPGEALSEASLSAALGIGRTPVHQAVDRLMREGLIEVLPRKGIMVRPVSLDEVLDIIEVRLVNETACVSRAARNATPQGIEKLKDNLQQAQRATKQRDIEALMHLDRAFHILISGMAGNPVQGDILRTLHERSLRFWFISLRAPDHHRRVCDQHETIVDALEKRDPETAERTMHEHIEAFRANITRQI
jgi:DNA-binding GntR family transcriptional regulator